MPRAKGTPKTGGRVKGQPNKATVEKTIIAERIMSEATMSGKKLGKEVLDDFMGVFASMAAYYQPRPGPDGKLTGNPVGNEDKFQQYARLAMQAAKDLAPFQSPTFRAVVVAPAPQQNTGSKVTKFTFGIFGEAATAKAIAGNKASTKH